MSQFILFYFNLVTFQIQSHLHYLLNSILFSIRTEQIFKY